MPDTETAIQRDEPQSVPLQIRNILRDRIVSGQYAAGKCFGSIRQLAGDFAVSPVTVIKALDLLEEEQLIRRVPMKGIYVSQKKEGLQRRLNICFPFPEKELSPTLILPENWALSSELQRGLLAGIAEQNAALQFLYFEDTQDEKLLAKQMISMEPFDMVVFVGHQLERLRIGVASRMPTYVLYDGQTIRKDPNIITVDYNRSAALSILGDHICDCGCRTVGTIMTSEQPKINKLNAFHEQCLMRGLETPTQFQWTAEPREGAEKLADIFRKGIPDFLFCLNCDLLRNIYEAAEMLGLRPGRDIQIAGISTGITTAGMIPGYTHVRIPRFEMGLEIARTGIRDLREGRPPRPLPLFEVRLIQGQSTRPAAGKKKKE